MMQLGRPGGAVKLLLLLAVALLPSAARAEQVGANFFGSVNLAALDTWAWGAGTAAPNHELEVLIRAEVESRLGTKGYRRVESGAKFLVVSYVQNTPPLAILRVEVFVGEGPTLAFRGLASGVDQGTTRKNRKLVRRVVKEMFDSYPKAAR